MNEVSFIDTEMRELRKICRNDASFGAFCGMILNELNRQLDKPESDRVSLERLIKRAVQVRTKLWQIAQMPPRTDP